MRFLEWAEDFAKKSEFTYHSLEGARMTTPRTVEIEGVEFSLDDLAWKDLGRFLGFSVKGLEKASDSLKVATFNDFLEQFDNADVVIHSFGGEVERFYRPDHPLLPVGSVLLVLTSIFNRSLGFTEDFVVKKVSPGAGVIIVDILSPEKIQGWEDKDYSLRGGARVELSLDTKSSSRVETLLEFSPSFSNEDPFYISVPLPERRSRVSAKGLTKNEIFDSFQVAMEGALRAVIDWGSEGLRLLQIRPMSQAGPKLATMIEESGVPKGIRPRLRERILEEHPDFQEKGRLSELDAVFMLGSQTSLLGKSRAKVEHYLGCLLAKGGDQVIVCGCCGQRLPEDSKEGSEWLTT